MNFCSKSLALLASITLSACGYHVAGKADLVPKSIRTIASLPFTNATTRYELTDRLPQAISHEFITRTRYRVVTDPAQADAVLRGTVINFVTYPIQFDQATGRASGLAGDSQHAGQPGGSSHGQSYLHAAQF